MWRRPLWSVKDELLRAYAVQAGVSQASDTHSGYGQGIVGYGKRFGAALLDGTAARFFCTYAFPSLLHQDPRYFRKGEGSSWSRVGYSITRAFVTRADSGPTQPNWSNIFGKFAGAGLSNLYDPTSGSWGKSVFYPSGYQATYQDAAKPRNRILARDPLEVHQQEVEMMFRHYCPPLSFRLPES